jgi:hypothetical protein
MLRSFKATIDNETVSTELLDAIKAEAGDLFYDAKTQLLYAAQLKDNKEYAMYVLQTDPNFFAWGTWSAQLVGWLASLAGNDRIALTCIARVCCWRREQVDLFETFIKVRDPKTEELVRQILTKTISQYPTPFEIISVIFRECLMVIEKAPIWSVLARSPIKAFPLFINFDLADRLSIYSFYLAGKLNALQLVHCETMKLNDFLVVLQSKKYRTLAIFDIIDKDDLASFLCFVVLSIINGPIRLELFELIFEYLRTKPSTHNCLYHIATRVNQPYRMRALGLYDTLQ